ncbi:MAG: hypothetical protein QNL04_11330 [SAR324 cluster bacterium]|nr:hypothetical protein [SAR324 cluster bacterium]
MKAKLFLLTLLFPIAVQPLFAGEPKGEVTGALVSYYDVSTETDAGETTSTSDMVTLPYFGYHVSVKKGLSEASALLNVAFDGAEFDVVDQYITYKTGDLEFFLGHEEFMDLTLGGENIVWIDGSMAIGNFGLIGRDDIFQVSLAGIKFRTGINSQTDEDTDEGYTTNHTSLSYTMEGDFSFLAGGSSTGSVVDADVSPTLEDAALDGQSETASFLGLHYTWGEGSGLAFNGEQATTQSGVAGSEASVATTMIVTLDIGMGDGIMNIDSGSVSTADASDNPTVVTNIDVSYGYSPLENVTIWVGYTAATEKDDDDATDKGSSETGAGVFYAF